MAKVSVQQISGSGVTDFSIDVADREFVALAEPRPVQEARDKQSRSVRELVAQVETAERNRDDDQRQSDGRPQQPRRAWG